MVVPLGQQVAFTFYTIPLWTVACYCLIQLYKFALTTTGRWNKRSVFKWNNSTAAFDQLTAG